MYLTSLKNNRTTNHKTMTSHVGDLFRNKIVSVHFQGTRHQKAARIEQSMNTIYVFFSRREPSSGSVSIYMNESQAETEWDTRLFDHRLFESLEHCLGYVSMQLCWLSVIDVRYSLTKREQRSQVPTKQANCFNCFNSGNAFGIKAICWSRIIFKNITSRKCH